MAGWDDINSDATKATQQVLERLTEHFSHSKTAAICMNIACYLAIGDRVSLDIMIALMCEIYAKQIEYDLTGIASDDSSNP